jgi:hypothetical protein
MSEDRKTALSEKQETALSERQETALSEKQETALSERQETALSEKQETALSEKQETALSEKQETAPEVSRTPDPPESGTGGGLGWTSVLFSALAAAFGVQSRRNRERDFTQGNALAFIAAGLIVTIAFIAIVMTVVNMVLAAR